MQIANLCPISQPLEIIHEIINCNPENSKSLTELIHYKFLNEILSEETEKLIPSLEAPGNNSLIKICNATILQDCIEDEFYQPFVKSKEDGLIVNSGLWTRSLYDPSGIVSECEVADYSQLQVRKRLLAACKSTGKPFILALYRQGSEQNEEEWEKWRQETFKMNSMHRFIGIYEECERECGKEENEGAEILPTVHLIKRSEHVFDDLVNVPETQFETVRNKLVDYLTVCLGGSKTAAEALMLSLVSRPSMRVDGLVDSLFIGKLALNLCVKRVEGDCDPAMELVKLLKGIKPFVSGPIRVESSAEGSFTKESIYPRLDVSTGQLRLGAALQQPDGCVLVVDEIGLKEGEFKDQAVCNLQSLIDLIRFQHVNYDFGMQQVPLKTDIPVITVSLEKKSVLPFDLKVECETVRVPEGAAVDDLGVFYAYLHQCRLMNCTVTEEMANFLEQDYLSLRKSSPLLPTGNPKMNEQEFHRLMNLARLNAVSRGRNVLDREIWEETKLRYI